MKTLVVSWLALVLSGGFTIAHAVTNTLPMPISQAEDLAVVRSNTLASITRMFGAKLVPPSDLSEVNRNTYADIVASFYMAEVCLARSRTNDAIALYRDILKKYPMGNQAACAHRMLLLLDGNLRVLQEKAEQSSAEK